MRPVRETDFTRLHGFEVYMVQARLKEKSKFKKYGSLMLFLLPGVLLAFVFCYVPMAGLIMAFKQEIDLTTYTSSIASIIMTPWGGFSQFAKLFAANSDFLRVLGNTLFISVMKIVLVFPVPIILAILITEVKNKVFNKAVQSVMYLPHFLSWAVVASVFMTFMHPNTGALNAILKLFGCSIDVSSANQFPWIMVLTTAWKDIGWSAVAYIAAILAIDTEQYEAAKIDGAGKLKQIWHITLPGIAGTVAVLLIMRIGYLMDAGFEQIYAMLTPTAESKGEIIGTYIYKLAIKNGGSYALTTAAGLFNSVISLVLVLGGNLFCKKVFNRSIW